MTGPEGALELAHADDAWTRADWEKATAAVLRKSRRMSEEDADSLVWDKLTRRTLDGLDITPLGTPGSLEGLATAGRPARAGDWDVRALVEAGPEKQLNEAALVDLDGGVTSLWLQVDAGADLATLLEGVLLDLAPVALDAADPLAAAQAFLAHAGDTDLATGTNLGAPATADAETLAAVARLARERGLLGVVVDGTKVHDRGASDVTELGWVLAAGARVLRVLEAAGIGAADAAGLIELRLAVTDEQFASIAKLRAVRRLWARVLELSGVSTGSTGAVSVHAVTSRPMMSTYDPYVNMLRTTVAAFAAGVGGADSVTVLPFDAPLGRPDAFGRRIARNTHHLLIDESHVAHVADPAGGAYAVEELTDAMARAAWEALGRLDGADGADGPDAAVLEEMVAATVEQRDREVATRQRPLTGLTEFPNLGEELPARAPYAGWEGVRSYGAAFEAMRAEIPAGRVFLATMGPIAQHTARATFATNLLAAGGVGVDVAGATDGPEALVAAYGGQSVVCLAGADPTYAEWGEAAATALREAGASRVIIAGVSTSSTSGVFDVIDDSCAMGVDALAFLTRTREALR
ncbi:methylmalonyl-CoA mutase family protein [uncultured Nocardioides sp.]|uniref:methylmalonyl-CoA mutase family protein n=1 Tax=uncultured Nocardioides sp. TaxID=198441 RepID=UPI00261C67B2|nr:methylmalonyl-CoA mutase family protein [uncultured Nocardioides sp.]